MEYYVKSVVPIIESNYDKFTTVERNIADFFIQTERKWFSSKSISERLFVSEASLSRFAKKCGYRGYREFIYQYEETFVEKQESITGNTRMILNAYQELLNKTYSLVDEAQIARISRYLSQAERVFVWRNRKFPGLAAREMELRFMRIGVDIDSLVERDMMRMQAVFQDRRSLVFGISISGSKEEVLFLLKEAYRKGAKTILFTANNRGGFEQFCTEVVLIPSLRHLNHGNVISPQFPILVMLDIIYSYYLEQDKYEKEVLHDNTLRALEEGEGMHRSF